MKFESVETSNDVLAILLFLNADEYITSSVIRDKFNYLNENTLRSWLKNWVKTGILNKLELIPDVAGGDKAKFKLSSIGLRKREELVERFLKTLNNRIIRNFEKKQLNSNIEKKDGKEELIKSFLLEFSEEFMRVIPNDVLLEVQNRLQKMLNEYF